MNSSVHMFVILKLRCRKVGHKVAQLVEASRYKPEGRGFDSRWSYKRQTSIHSAGFQTAIQEIKELQTYALDCAITGIGVCSVYIDLRRFSMIGGGKAGVNTLRTVRVI